MDEGGFILDYLMPAGSSLADTNRMIFGVEKILGRRRKSRAPRGEPACNWVWPR